MFVIEANNSLTGIITEPRIRFIIIRTTSETAIAAYILKYDSPGPNSWLSFYPSKNREKKIVIFGKLQVEEEKAQKIIAHSIYPLGGVRAGLCIELGGKNEGELIVNRIQDILRNYPGKMPVFLKIKSQNKTIKAFEELWINPTEKFFIEITKIIPENQIYFVNY